MRKNMVLKMNNKSDNFYNYMGKFFGSRLVQNKINDRVYDDPNKEWYVLLEEEKPVAFLSMVENTMKNVYSLKDEQLERLLKCVKKDVNIQTSVVPKVYLDTYKKLDFQIYDESTYKNFVVIGGSTEGCRV